MCRQTSYGLKKSYGKLLARDQVLQLFEDNFGLSEEESSGE